MVPEFVTGSGFDAIKAMDQEARDRVGEIVFRFFFGWTTATASSR